MITRRTATMAIGAYLGTLLGQRTANAQTRSTRPVDPTPAEMRQPPKGLVSAGPTSPIWSAPTDITIALGAPGGLQTFHFTFQGEIVTYTAAELFLALRAGR